jgi:hypothetical protein
MIVVMKKTLIIKGVPFEYESVDLTTDDAESITFEQARAILMKAKQLLGKYGIRFWLHYGTLLGAIREHGFISHDYDVDIMTDDGDKLLEAIPDLAKEGFILIRAESGLIYSFSYSGVYIDIYIKSEAPFPLNLWCYRLNGHFVPKSLMKGLQEIDFLGERFNVPLNPEKLLRFYYGDTWRTPIKGKHGTYTIWPHRLYRRLFVEPKKRHKS